MKVLLRFTILPALFASLAEAQVRSPEWPVPINLGSITTASTDEETLLLLQLIGRAPLLPATIRSFTETAVDSMTAPLRGTEQHRRMQFHFARPSVGLRYNTDRASDTQGVVWSGRGLTAAASLGGIARMGPFSVAIRPVAFWTQNRPFQPILNAPESLFVFPPNSAQIDLPYRFGNKSYGRIDPGESWAQLDTRWVAAGISTATQTWGPMHVYPLLLGPEAGGFPHVFAGTGLPWNLWIGKLSTRLAVGRLDPSAFAPPHAGADPRRLASELVAVFTPRGADGLEIGAGRFFHRRWPEEGIDWSVLQIPTEALLKKQLPHKDDPNAIPDNQLASIFFRLVRPASGVELYGEFLRDDHNYDINDLAGEPDHDSAYSLGLRKAWLSDTKCLTALTIEIVNGRVSHLAELRGETPLYVHGQITEGHTERGKLLASPAAMNYGYHADLLRRNGTTGWRASLALESEVQNEEGGSWSGTFVGQHVAELSRILSTSHGEVDTTLRIERAWNDLSGANNVGLYFTYRP